jgi:hypothetical protein
MPLDHAQKDRELLEVLEQDPVRFDDFDRWAAEVVSWRNQSQMRLSAFDLECLCAAVKDRRGADTRPSEEIHIHGNDAKKNVVGSQQAESERNDIRAEAITIIATARTRPLRYAGECEVSSLKVEVTLLATNQDVVTLIREHFARRGYVIPPGARFTQGDVVMTLTQSFDVRKGCEVCFNL